jgi:hypothetical protein
MRLGFEKEIFKQCKNKLKLKLKGFSRKNSLIF